MKMPFKYPAPAYLAFVIVSLFCSPVSAQNARPANYDQIKIAIGAYKDAIDYADSDQVAAKEGLRVHADDAVPALKMLFSENEDDQYRATIIALFFYAKASYSDTTAFVANQLTSSPEYGAFASRLEEKSWISLAFKFLTKFDQAKARQISVQALWSANLWTQGAAIQTLKIVGTTNEISPLSAYVAHPSVSTTNTTPKELISEASDAIKEIRNRGGH